MREVWKTISEFKDYEISNLANVRKGKEPVKIVDIYGIPKVILEKEGKKSTRTLSILWDNEFEGKYKRPKIIPLPEIAHNAQRVPDSEHIEWLKAIRASERKRPVWVPREANS